MINNIKKLSFVFTVVSLAACTQNQTKVVSGTLTMGPEVRAFIEDGQTKEYWVIDKGGRLYEQYKELAPISQGVYTPVKAKLKVLELPKMEDGFGADYDGTYSVVEVISITPK